MGEVKIVTFKEFKERYEKNLKDLVSAEVVSRNQVIEHIKVVSAIYFTKLVDVAGYAKAETQRENLCARVYHYCIAVFEIVNEGPDFSGACYLALFYKHFTSLVRVLSQFTSIDVSCYGSPYLIPEVKQIIEKHFME